MENGYSLCLNEWALDKSIKNELGLLLIISSLCAERGYCYASNKYLADIFDTNEVVICRKIKKLEEKKYISIEYKRQGSYITMRYIRLTKKLMAVNKKVNGTINKKVKENNISIKNTSIKNIIPVWFDKKIENEKLTDKEKKEMETLLKEFKNETN